MSPTRTVIGVGENEKFWMVTAPVAADATSGAPSNASETTAPATHAAAAATPIATPSDQGPTLVLIGVAALAVLALAGVLLRLARRS